MKADGLDAIDCTDVLRGNEDIVCEAEAPKPDAVKAVLPGHMIGCPEFGSYYAVRRGKA